MLDIIGSKSGSLRIVSSTVMNSYFPSHAKAQE